MTSSLLKKCAVSAVPALLAAASLLSTAPAAGAFPTGSASPPVGDAVPAANNSTPGPNWGPHATTTPCGEGAQLVGAWYLRDPAHNVGGVADLYWKNSTGDNCLVVNATGSRYGQTNQVITAVLRTSDGTHQKADSGHYRYFAGPVSVPARHRCVDVLGRIQVFANGHITDTYQAQAKHVACS